MRISDWSSDVCSSDLNLARRRPVRSAEQRLAGMIGKKKPGARSRHRIVEGDRPKTVGIEKIRARSRILVDRDDQRAAIARPVRALDIPLGLDPGPAFAGPQIAPDAASALAADAGGVVRLPPFSA